MIMAIYWENCVTSILLRPHVNHAMLMFNVNKQIMRNNNLYHQFKNVECERTNHVEQPSVSGAVCPSTAYPWSRIKMEHFPTTENKHDFYNASPFFQLNSAAEAVSVMPQPARAGLIAPICGWSCTCWSSSKSLRRLQKGWRFKNHLPKNWFLWWDGSSMINLYM